MNTVAKIDETGTLKWVWAWAGKVGKGGGERGGGGYLVRTAPRTSENPACSHSASPYFITPTSVRSSEFFTTKRELCSTLCADALISLLL